MRPRIGFLTYLWGIIRSDAGDYNFTILDVMLAEMLLGILAVPVALQIWSTRTATSLGCRFEGYTYPVTRLWPIWGALVWNIMAGVSSAFLLATFIIRRFKESSKGKDWQFSDEIWPHMVLSIGSFISNWILWTSKFTITHSFFHQISNECREAKRIANILMLLTAFVKVAGNSYCPGNLAGSGAYWMVTIVLNSVVRPLLGGIPH